MKLLYHVPGSSSIWPSLLWKWLAHLESDSETKRVFSVRYEHLWPKCKLCPSPFKLLPGKLVFKRWGTDNLFSLTKTFLFPTYAQPELLALHAAHNPEGYLGEESKDHTCLLPEQFLGTSCSPQRGTSQEGFSGGVTKQPGKSFPWLCRKCFDGHGLFSPGRVSKCKSRLPLEFGFGCTSWNNSGDARQAW